MLLAIMLVAISVIMVFVPWLWSRRQMYLLSWKLNGPFAWPIVGNGLNLIRHEDNIKYTTWVSNNYNSPIRLWIGPKLLVMVDNAHDAEAILGSPHCLNKEECYKYIREAATYDGLFSANASIWKQHLKLISPTFGQNSVYSFLPVFNKHTSNLIDIFSCHLDKGIFSSKRDINKATIDMILEATLGMNVDEGDKTVYSTNLEKVQRAVSKRIYQPWYQIDCIWRFTKYPRIIEDFRRIYTKIFDKLITDRLAYGSDQLKLIDRLLRISEENDGFTTNDVRGECNTIMMAGSDTSALTTSTTLLMLAIHQNAQQKVLEELLTTFPNTKNPEITRADLESLQYLERCIKETLRLFPMVAMICRQNVKPIKLGEHIIPADTSLAINIYCIHRNPDHWGPNAGDFEPNRFEGDKLKKMHPYSFLAFSGGARHCVGYRYAMAVVKMALAKILLNYHVTTPIKYEEVQISMDINSHFLCNHLMEIHKR